jgi:hypothetical protein
MIETTPWIVAAGSFLAHCHQGLSSPNQIDRMSAETMMGMARTAFRESTLSVAFLKACYDLELAGH